MTAPSELATVTLRIVSPCEHGVSHHIRSVAVGTEFFSCPECRDSRGVPRTHVVTAAKYPRTERKR